MWSTGCLSAVTVTMTPNADSDSRLVAATVRKKPHLSSACSARAKVTGPGHGCTQGGGRELKRVDQGAMQYGNFPYASFHPVLDNQRPIIPCIGGFVSSSPIASDDERVICILEQR